MDHHALAPFGVVLVLASGSPGCTDALGEATPFTKKAGRCDLRPKADQCTDWRDFAGPSMAAMEASCESLVSATGGGSWTEGKRCDTTHMLGGCQTKSNDGTVQTSWYYHGAQYKTVDDARSECRSEARWVGPP